MKRSLAFIALLVTLMVLSGCGRTNAEPQSEARTSATRAIDDAALSLADEHVGDWLTHGRTYSEQRYSPLDQINEDTVPRLGLKWSLDLNTTRGVEATPIVVDGVIYTTLPWSIVLAVDARTGKQIWKYDPKVPRSWGRYACCDVVNRGPAVYKGNIYVGTIDGRLVAINAATGERMWETITIDQSKPYTITGAPRIVKGRVIIGNGGAELGVRGYVSAYDAETGRLDWRFYTVPGDSGRPFASPAHEMAAKTWIGDDWWNSGGGGTAWDSFSFDPELNLLYIGTGNSSAWARQVRAEGDNLFISSIVAVRPDTGEYVWHYQTTPGDHWDYTAVQQMTLADLEINGVIRKVIMQAPKNGFFYVLDRATGELLSAAPFAEITWAEGIDMETGRPVENSKAVYGDTSVVVKPSPLGAHNWHSQSYNPNTGLVYLPVQDMAAAYGPVDKDYKHDPGWFNIGTEMEIPAGEVTGYLVAWDPLKQRRVWSVRHGGIYNGGTLTSAGNLVFQGASDGRFVVYSADQGDVLWEFPVNTGIVAAPVTYLVDGQQYITVNAGWGGGWPMLGGDQVGRAGVKHGGQLLTFVLDGNAKLPLPKRPQEPMKPPAITSSQDAIEKGSDSYADACFGCHGSDAISGGVTTDLRFRSTAVRDLALLKRIVLEGVLEESSGMPDLSDRLDAGDVEAIQAYILSRAEADYDRAMSSYKEALDAWEKMQQ